MKLTAKVKLQPSAKQADALKRTIETVNGCCDWISEEAWESKTFGQYSIHKLCYHPARAAFPLSSQMVVRAISKVAAAYKLDQWTKRTFRKLGAIAYDDRILRFSAEATVSIWSVDGRLKMPYSSGERQSELLKSQQGETDLIYHRGKFYLAATCNVDAPAPSDVDDFLGVDLGIANVASDSDGKHYSGSQVKSVRHRHRRLRIKLQKKQTRAAKRRLKKLAGKECRFASHTNHVISKQIVETAKRTGRGLKLEDLKGIRERIRARRSQRAVLHSWAFAQLGVFLAYKATLAGVPLIAVDPRNTSRECSECGHIDKKNRPDQSTFRCLACGHAGHADINAARVIAGRPARKPGEGGRARLSDLCGNGHKLVKSRRL